jgi:hypothetical protein
MKYYQNTIALMGLVLALQSPVSARPAGSVLGELPKSLEEQIDLALKFNPEVLMAEASVQQAQAAYRQVRLRIAQEIMQVHNEMTSHRYRIDQAMIQLDEAKRQFDMKVVPRSEVLQAEGNLIQTKHALGEIEAKLHYLLGADLTAVKQSPPPKEAPGKFVTKPAGQPRPVRPEMPANLRQVFDTPVSVVCNDTPLTDLVQLLNLQFEGKKGNFTIVTNELFIDHEYGPPGEITLNFKLGNQAGLGKILTAVTDLTGLCFVAREYGLLLTTPNQAYDLYAATIPAGLMVNPKTIPTQSAGR